MLGRLACIMVAVCAVFAMGAAAGGDVYYETLLKDLTFTDGSLPPTSGYERNGTPFWQNAGDLKQPYAAGDAGEEIYVIGFPEAYSRVGWMGPVIWGDVPWTVPNLRMFIRAPGDKAPSGRLYVPKPDWDGMTMLRFSATTPAQDQPKARERFRTAKRMHFECLARMGIPGAAWFRHCALAASGTMDGTAPGASPRNGGSETNTLQDTYALFTGGRAVSENLQLDRELRGVSPGDETVPLDTISGITTAAVPWKELIRGMTPAKDFLAAYIPADQHALFFPSFQAMLDVLDETKARGIPVLRLVERQAEDAKTQQRYERQLCLEVDALTRLFGPQVIAHVAVTGSDPYLRTGSDVAFLFEAVNVELVRGSIASHQAAAMPQAGVRSVSGNVQGVEYAGVASPNRSVCSYTVTVGNVVIVTNSLVQLDRILQAAYGKTPSIATLDEYTFFRDRYKLGDPDETAFLVLTDAAIRRWCGPRWRIASSRRTRAAAVLAELQAKNLDLLASGDAKPGPLNIEKPIPGLGDLTITPEGVCSSTYGSLSFLTPICELPMEKVTAQESSAYDWFRNGYQSNWRWFDPIAVRFTVARNNIAADLTVRPLILNSRYQNYVRIAGKASIPADAGDRHPEALAQFVLAFDRDADIVRSWNHFLSGMILDHSSLLSPADCVGSWIGIYADDADVWREVQSDMEKSRKLYRGDLLTRHLGQLPVAFQMEVADPVILTAVLTGLRATIEKTSPAMFTWETATHLDRPYVKVIPAADAKGWLGDQTGELALYYLPTPTRFVLTFSEKLMHRVIERMQQKQNEVKADPERPIQAEPWLGQHANLRLGSNGLRVARGLFGQEVAATLQRRAWSNIPILNEWRRRYPAQSPIAFHEKFWGAKLVCPGGGEYIWNEECQTMESTVFGHPGQPKSAAEIPTILPDITQADLGLTFEDNGLRARAILTRDSSKEIPDKQ